MKKIIVLLLAVMICTSGLCGIAVSANNAFEVELLLQIGNQYMYILDEPVVLDAAPIIYNSRTMLPIRAVVEALGGTVGWNPNDQQITIDVGDTQILMWINNHTISVNGKNNLMDVAPFIMNERTLVPVRFVSDNIPGCKTIWDGNTQSVSILFSDYEDPTLYYNGKTVEYGETFASVENKFPDMQKVGNWYNLDDGIRIMFREYKMLEDKSRETLSLEERPVVMYLIAEDGVGFKNLKVGDSYDKIQKEYKKCEPVDLVELEKANGTVMEESDYSDYKLDEKNCEYMMLIDEEGNEYSIIDRAEKFRELANNGDTLDDAYAWQNELMYLDILVEDGKIVKIYYGDYRAIMFME